MFETINYSVADHIAQIQFNRPERHNALSYDLVRDLDSAFDAAEDDPECGSSCSPARASRSVPAGTAATAPT